MAEGLLRVKARDSLELWDKRGRCRKLARTAKNELDVEEFKRLNRIFFPTRHDNMEVVNEARGICSGCPVRLDCLAYSITNWEKVGIWGGETEIERRSTRREARTAGVLGPVSPKRHQQVVAWLFRRQLSRAEP